MSASPIDMKLLASLPQHVVETRLRSPRGVTEYRFRGALLYDYAQWAGLLPREGAMANQYFVATAEDNFVVAVAMAEVSPEYTDKQVLLATEQNGEPIRQGVRLVVPGDDLGGRSVYGLAGLEVRSVESVPISGAPPSSFVTLRGGLDRPGDVDREALAAMKQSTVETRPSKGHNDAVRPSTAYQGVLVWDLLESAGIRLDESMHEPFLRKIIVARDGDGYGVVVAGGEIEPRFENAPFLVALSDARGPLGESDGGLRLIAPFDLAGARSVKGLSSLELREV